MATARIGCVSWAVAFPVPAPSYGDARFSRPPAWQDREDGGNYQITGTVDELGVAGRYRVRLLDRYSGRLIREIWSDSDGNYAFTRIAYRPEGYFLVAHDYGGDPLNAAIADLVTPEIMS